MRENITLRLPTELKAKAKQMAHDNYISLNALIIQALWAWVNQE